MNGTLTGHSQYDVSQSQATRVASNAGIFARVHHVHFINVQRTIGMYLYNNWICTKLYYPSLLIS